MADTILFVTASPGKRFGGGKRVFYSLIKELDRSQFRPLVVCSPEGFYAEMLSEAGIALRPLNMENRYNPWTIFRLAKIMKQESVTIIHSQGGVRTNYFALLAAKLAGIKRIVSTVAVLAEGYDVNPFKKNMYVVVERFIERFMDRFIAVSEALRETLINKHKIPSDKVIKIYNGIDLKEYQLDNSGESFKKIREEFNIEDRTYLIGVIGRMVWEKGIEYLIRAAKDICHNNNKIIILIVGDGPLKEELQRLAINLGIGDKVIFTGFRKHIKEVLSSIDLLVVPSLSEGFPMVSLEAMAMGKPIIASKINGITEQIIDGRDGILVPPKDPSAIAKAITRVLTDKENARKMGLEARKKVEQKFSVKKMVSETEKVYLSLLKVK